MKIAKKRTLTPLQHVDNGDLVWSPMWYHLRGLSQTASGYGGKLNTGYKTEYNGRMYRVYCMIWSNSGTCYIISKGQRLIISNDNKA